MGTKEIYEGSPAIRASTLAYSDNFMLTTGGILNIYNNLTEEDCDLILAEARLVQVQFARAFDVSESTFELINRRLLTVTPAPQMRFNLNGVGAITDLSCLRWLPNLKAMSVDFCRLNQIDKINKYLLLEKLGIGGHRLSIKRLEEQTELEELFLFQKLKDVEEVVNQMTWLRKLTFSMLTMKGFDFLVGLNELRELHFMQGSATNYERLPDIGKIERLSYKMVRMLKIDHLWPINEMEHLKELTFKSQPHLTDLDWLTKQDVDVEVSSCRNFRD